MRYTEHYTIGGPESTPSAIIKLVAITVVVSIFSALFDGFISRIFEMPGPVRLLSLSWYGINNLFLWQPITYFFVEESYGQGITLNFLLFLAFQMYILWVLGSQLLQQVGQRSFLALYFSSGVIAGIAALLVQTVVGARGLITGPQTPLLAVFTAWTLFNKNTELLLFFFARVQARWLWAAIVCAIVLINLSQGDVVSMALNITAVVVGYAYAVAAWQLSAPFPRLSFLDRIIDKTTSAIARMTAWVKRKGKGKAKIFDIKTGEELHDDDEFIDAMLAKISKHGENALTWQERRRLDRLAAKKSKEREKQ